MPNELPSAKFGDNYNARVELVGGAIMEHTVLYTIQPPSAGIYRTTEPLHAVEQMQDDKIEGDGLSVKCIGDHDWDICETIEIKGNINIKQDVVVGIMGSTFGTSVPGIQFKKDFIIYVKE